MLQLLKSLFLIAEKIAEHLERREHMDIGKKLAYAEMRKQAMAALRTANIIRHNATDLDDGRWLYGEREK